MCYRISLLLCVAMLAMCSRAEEGGPDTCHVVIQAQQPTSGQTGQAIPRGQGIHTGDTISGNASLPIPKCCNQPNVSSPVKIKVTLTQFKTRKVPNPNPGKGAVGKPQMDEKIKIDGTTVVDEQEGRNIKFSLLVNDKFVADGTVLDDPGDGFGPYKATSAELSATASDSRGMCASRSNVESYDVK